MVTEKLGLKTTSNKFFKGIDRSQQIVFNVTSKYAEISSIILYYAEEKNYKIIIWNIEKLCYKDQFGQVALQSYHLK